MPTAQPGPTQSVKKGPDFVKKEKIYILVISETVSKRKKKGSALEEHFMECSKKMYKFLQLYFQVHTLDRVFQCPQCEKGFKELRTLRLHLKIHNAEYPEQCGVCQKVFRTKWQLKQHQMDHGGERPYPCPECSFTCKTKQQLNEHRRKHSVSTYIVINT